MARQDSYYPYRPNYATEVGMVYNPIDLSAANEIVAQQLGQRTQMYQQNLDAIAAAENEMESQKFRDVDRPGINVRLQNFSKDIDDMVKNQYQGDYAMARKDILRKIAKERGEISRATQLYDVEQKYLPIMAQLRMQGKYIGGNPEQQSAYDPETGQFTSAPIYDFKERSDYDKIIMEDIVSGIDKTTKDTGLISSGVEGILKDVKTRGLAALGNNPTEINARLSQIAKEYAPVFGQKSTYDIDPTMQHMDKEEYIKDAVYRLASSISDNQFVNDPLAIERSKHIDRLTERANKAKRVYGPGIGIVQPNTALQQGETYENMLTSKTGVFRSGLFGGYSDVDKSIASLEKELESYQVQDSLDNLHDMRRQGKITEEDYTTQKDKLRKRQDELNAMQRRGEFSTKSIYSSQTMDNVRTDLDNLKNIKKDFAVARFNLQDSIS